MRKKTTVDRPKTTYKGDWYLVCTGVEVDDAGGNYFGEYEHNLDDDVQLVLAIDEPCLDDLTEFDDAQEGVLFSQNVCFDAQKRLGLHILKIATLGGMPGIIKLKKLEFAAA